MMGEHRLVLLGLFLSAAGGPAAAQDSASTPRSIAEVEVRILRILKETKTPGAGVAIVSLDSLIWVAGLGTADVASGRDATAETLFRIGSTSKAFTSLMVLMLQEQGKLSLEDPVRTHIPEIGYENQWEAEAPIRIVHLLEHATGWDDFALRDYANNDPTPLTLRQGLDFNPRTRISRWRPGTRVSYCNSGPPVAAYIVEKIEGRPFDDLARERLFVPIGMITATYLPPADPAQAATLYHPDGVTPYPYWHILARPAGSINASARDMAAYVRFLLNRGTVDGRELIPPAEIERMERPRSSLTATAGLDVGYGLHLATYVDSGFVWVGHDGGMEGGLTVMSYRPEKGVGFAFMINSASGTAYEDITRVLRDYLTRDEPRPALPPAGPMPAAARERAGWYVPDNPRQQGLRFIGLILGLVRVRVDDSVLSVKPLFGKARRYLPVSGTLFRGTKEPVPTLALVNDVENGRAEAIELVGYLLPASFHRIPAWRAGLSLGLTAAFLLGLASTLLFALVWVPRKLLGKLRGVPYLRLRVWPLVAALSVAGVVGPVMLSMDDLIVTLGTRTPTSMAIFAGTLLFPLASALGLFASYRPAAQDVRPWLRRHARFVGVVFIIAAAYLAWSGIVGWRSWA